MSLSPPARTGLLAFGLASGVFLLAAVVVGGLLAFGRSSVKPAADGKQPAADRLPGKRDGDGPRRPAEKETGRLPRVKEPENVEKWTHRELAEYLRAKGVTPLKVVASQEENSSAWFVLHDRSPSVQQLDTLGPLNQGDVDVCQVSLMNTVEGARDVVGRYVDDARYWAWGRFVFFAKAPVIRKFRSALGA